MDENTLVVLIANFVQNTPPGIIQEVINTIQGWQDIPSKLQKTKLLSSIQSPQTRFILKKIMDCWTAQYPEIISESISLSLQVSSRTLHTANPPSIELIWTGPKSALTNLRRTDQALLELINGAHKSLLVVSFAVYKAQPIIDAIEKAILRNVKVTICLEDAAESQGRLSLSGMKSFSSSIFRLASFYTWPLEKRARTPEGKFGTLHAKLAVADQQRAFISSANLTDYAMDLNMEMGALIESSEIGWQISALFNDLIVNGVFQRVSME